MNNKPRNVNGKLLVAILEQFEERGKIFTYLPDFMIGPTTYAVFKVYRKRPLSLKEKIQIFFGEKCKWRRGLIALQSTSSLKNVKIE